MLYPELIFSESSLLNLIKKHVTAQTLIIADEYNFPVLKTLGLSVLVTDQEIEHIEQVRRQHYTRVIAVGGCTALDFGRACAINKDLIVVPTILSNSCISTNRSVIKRGSVYKSEETAAPRQTIISIPTIVKNHSDQIKHWSASGIGDLLSAVSASIEFEYDKNKSFSQITAKKVTDNIPAVVEALEWINTSFQDYDRSKPRPS